MVLTDIIANFLELLTLLSSFLIVIFIASLIFRKKIKLNFINDNLLLFGFLVSLVATLGSLFYSEIMHYNPCKLCWFQRIFMYPQAFLFAVALLKKDKNIFNYSIILSIIGFSIALFHYAVQLEVITPNLPCTAVGMTGSCSEFFFLSFGYITIPFMSLSAFTLLLILFYLSKRHSHESHRQNIQQP